MYKFKEFKQMYHVLLKLYIYIYQKKLIIIRAPVFFISSVNLRSVFEKCYKN